MEEVERLRDEHALIATMAQDLAATVARPYPPEPLQFLNDRRSLGRALTRHLRHEDWVVYPRLRASKRPEMRETGARLSAEAAAFSAAFSDYGQQWTTAGIAADWPGFQAATRSILADLERRMVFEDEDIYPLLGQPGISAAAPARGGRHGAVLAARGADGADPYRPKVAA